MPRDWEKHWPLNPIDGQTQDDAEEQREELINTVGNLTLLTKELNPSVSNGPWNKKRFEILKHSALNLNRELPEQWSEKDIIARTEVLSRKALQIWMRPLSASALAS
jgi:hypothetical protein